MQKACTSFRYRLFTSTIKSYKMNIKKNIIKAFIGGIAACLCMACGGSDSKDYWGDTSGGGDEEPTENPNASKPRYIWIDAAANFPDFANSKENIARDLALAKDAGFTDIVVDVRPTTGDVLFKTNHVDQVKFMYAWIGSNYTKVERTATWD